MAGDPDVVRELRRHFPTTPEAVPDDPTRRVCNGVGVLKAAREGSLPASVPAGLAAELAPLDDLLDTCADLLLVDGVHALVTRSPEAGGAAMEAAAGLGSPPTLHGIRTPREATTVSVQCWLVLPAAGAGPSRRSCRPGRSRVRRTASGGRARRSRRPGRDRAGPGRRRHRSVGGGRRRAGRPWSHAATAELAQRWHGAQLAARSPGWRRRLDAPAPLRTSTNSIAMAPGPSRRAARLDPAPTVATEAVARLRERLRPLADGPPSLLADLRTQLRTLVGRSWLPILPVVSAPCCLRGTPSPRARSTSRGWRSWPPSSHGWLRWRPAN